MEKLIATLCFLSALPAFSEPPRRLSHVVASKTTFLSIDKTLRFFGSHRTSSHIGSSIDAEISGVYEGNLCGADTVALRFEQDITAARHKDAYKVLLNTLTLNRKSVSPGNQACIEISQPTPFKTLIRSEVTSWEEDQKDMTFTYALQGSVGQDIALLMVAYNARDGWSGNLIHIYE